MHVCMYVCMHACMHVCIIYTNMFTVLVYVHRDAPTICTCWLLCLVHSLVQAVWPMLEGRPRTCERLTRSISKPRRSLNGKGSSDSSGSCTDAILRSHHLYLAFGLYGIQKNSLFHHYLVPSETCAAKRLQPLLVLQLLTHALRFAQLCRTAWLQPTLTSWLPGSSGLLQVSAVHI